MGRLVGYKIDYTRLYIDTEPKPIPDFNYRYLFPITTYDAVHKTAEEGSTTLTLEISELYARISRKQEEIQAGTSGHLMTFTGIAGTVGSTEVIRTINEEAVDRSNRKIPSEVAVGKALDIKANLGDLNRHIGDLSCHIDEDERARWNSMATTSELSAHLSDESVHVTAEDKERWNSMAPYSAIESHITDNTSNPHNVDAHQTGTYTRYEIDTMFESIRESFFNYLNIEYNDRDSIATLSPYSEDNWNPNYVLAYGEDLPTVVENDRTYFAVRPMTDYATNESQDCRIYIKKPNMSWAEVSIEPQKMSPGDMVIRYPDGVMCVWLMGRFNMIYTNSYSPASITPSPEPSGEPTQSADGFWRPIISPDYMLSWVRSYSIDPPEAIYIKGPAGYTPVKGVDYVDGAPGIGVADGGSARDILVKTDGEDYETEWKPLDEVISDFLNNGGRLPGVTGVSTWDELIDRPEISQETGDSETDVMSQAAVTNLITNVDERLTAVENSIGSIDEGGGGIYSTLQEHINDTENPHHISPESIGAVGLNDFNNHAHNQENPHQVTAEQIGLGNVTNTSDEDKPVSRLTQAAIDAVSDRVDAINESLESTSLVTSVLWDDESCELTVNFKAGNSTVIPLPIIDVFQSIFYDEDQHELVLTLPDQTEHSIPVQSLITSYRGLESDNVKVEVQGDTIEARVVLGSLTGNELADDINIPGNPTTTTQLQSDDSNKIATTKYVKEAVINNLDSFNEDRPLSANMGRLLNEEKTSIEDVVAIIVDTAMLNVIDNLGSEDIHSALSANMGRELYLTKAPKVHTSPSGATFGRASVDLFGHTRASDVDPLMDGVSFVGTDDGRYARSDHRHPTDVTRAPISWPDTEHGLVRLLGEPRSVHPDTGVYDDRVATTLWVHENYPPIPDATLTGMVATAFYNTEEYPYNTNEIENGSIVYLPDTEFQI